MNQETDRISKYRCPFIRCSSIPNQIWLSNLYYEQLFVLTNRHLLWCKSHQKFQKKSFNCVDAYNYCKQDILIDFLIKIIRMCQWRINKYKFDMSMFSKMSHSIRKIFQPLLKLNKFFHFYWIALQSHYRLF